MSDYGYGVDAVKEVLLSGGKLEYCPMPTVDVKPPVALTYWQLGYTAKDSGGTLSDKPPEFKEIKVSGMTDPVKRKAVGREVTFKANLMQFNLENLRMATGGALTWKSQGIVTSLTAVATTYDFGVAMTPNDYVVFTSSAGLREVVKVGANVAASNYNITRGQDGTVGTAFAASDRWVCTGVTGDWLPGSNLLLGGKSQSPASYLIRYTVANPDVAGRNIILYLLNAQVTDAVEVKFADDDATGIQLTVKCFETNSSVVYEASVANKALLGYRYIMVKEV